MSKIPPRKKKKEELVEQVMDAHQSLVEDNMEKDEELREQFPSNVEGSKEFNEANEDVGLGVNQIHCGDTWEMMNKLEDGCIDMILTSPPYLASIRKDNHKYPGAKDKIKDNQTVEEYLDWMSDIFMQYERVLKDDGVIAFNFSYTTFNPSLPYDLINRVFKDTDLRIYDTLAWKKKSAVPLSGHPNRMTRIVEMVYIFAKTPNFKANKIVKSISKTGQKYFTAYYNFLEAKNNDGKVEGHEATFSSEFAQYFIDLYTKEGEIVLDNFVGTGTTPYTAAKMDRKYIGIDLVEVVEDYCEYSRNRVAKLYKTEDPDQ
jgi:DNA modification methylase